MRQCHNFWVYYPFNHTHKHLLLHTQTVHIFRIENTFTVPLALHLTARIWQPPPHPIDRHFPPSRCFYQMLKHVSYASSHYQGYGGVSPPERGPPIFRFVIPNPASPTALQYEVMGCYWRRCLWCLGEERAEEESCVLTGISFVVSEVQRGCEALRDTHWRRLRWLFWQVFWLLTSLHLKWNPANETFRLWC